MPYVSRTKHQDAMICSLRKNMRKISEGSMVGQTCIPLPLPFGAGGKKPTNIYRTICSLEHWTIICTI